jgi:hypothetical protein
MALKKFKDVGNTGFTKGWEDTCKDKFIQLKSGESKEVRFIDAFMETLYHWVPFMSKKQGRMTMFPQQCLKHSVHAKTEEESWVDDADCPACDLGLQTQANGVFPVLDIDALYAGDQKNALKLINLGPRERQKLEQLRKFNKVHGQPTDVADSLYGKIVQIVNDPKNKDPALRWQFNTGQRLRVKYNEETGVVRVTIPDNAESDHRGVTFKFTVPDIPTLVTYPTLTELKGKYERMRVTEAMEIYEENQKKYRKEKGEDDDEDDRPKRKKRSSDDDDDSPRSKGRKDRRPADDDDDDEPPKKKRRAKDDDDDDPPKKRRVKDDEDDDSDDDEPPKRRRPADDDDDDESPKKRKVKDDEDDDSDDDDDEPPKKKRRAKDDDDDDDESPRKRKVKDDDSDDDDDSGDDDDDEPPKKKRRAKDDDDDESPKRRRPADDDDDDDDESPKTRSRDSRRKSSKSDDDDDSDSDEDDQEPKRKGTTKKQCLKSDKGNKCPLHGRCYGRMGEPRTEDCTICPHKKNCHKMTRHGDDD